MLHQLCREPQHQSKDKENPIKSWTTANGRVPISKRRWNSEKKKMHTGFCIGPVTKGICSPAWNCILGLAMLPWRYCSRLALIWCAPNKLLSSSGDFWVEDLISLAGISKILMFAFSFNCLKIWKPWEPVAESSILGVGVCCCSWSECEDDECWESDRECSSCSDSTSHAFAVVVLLLFGCKVSTMTM